MARITGDFAGLLYAVATGAAFEAPALVPDIAMTVIIAADGYPATPRKGGTIGGIDAAEAIDGVTIFHAGTHRDGNRLVASGGRVLAVTALGATLSDARNRAYQGVAAIDYPDGFHRRDIGWRELERAR